MRGRDFSLPILLVYTGVILTISSLPGEVVRAGVSGVDIAYHFLAYLLLGVLASHALKRKNTLYAYVMAVAVIDELHQFIIPGRTVSPVDMAANITGALVGILMYHLTNRWWKTYGVA